jgi:aromatic ring hydroxylase
VVIDGSREVDDQHRIRRLDLLWECDRSPFGGFIVANVRRRKFLA